MTAGQTEKDDGKRYMIEAFFEDFGAKIERLRLMKDRELIEESVTLACCYLAALANHRFGEAGDEWRRFVRLIHAYADPELVSLFRKVSTVAVLADKGGRLADHKAISEVLVERFGEEPRVSGEPDRDELLAILRDDMPGIDLQNVSANLDRYTYAGELYLRLRYGGVHRASVSSSYDVLRNQPVMPRGLQGELIYYEPPFNRLQFSDEAVLRVLSQVHANLSAACASNLCWPRELESA